MPCAVTTRANLNFSGIDSSIATRALPGLPASLPPPAAALLPLHVAIVGVELDGDGDEAGSHAMMSG
eukprot:scaffold123706_cov101-Phaeocystis_antarctica.AAC.1